MQDVDEWRRKCLQCNKLEKDFKGTLPEIEKNHPTFIDYWHSSAESGSTGVRDFATFLT